MMAHSKIVEEDADESLAEQEKEEKEELRSWFKVLYTYNPYFNPCFWYFNIRGSQSLQYHLDFDIA